MVNVLVSFRVGTDRRTVETALNLETPPDLADVRRRIAARGITSPHQFPASAVRVVSLDLPDVTVEPSAFVGSALAVTTSHTCPACGQTISAVVGVLGDSYTECGGEGEGGCTPWIEGDPDANYAHHLAVTQAVQAAEFYRATHQFTERARNLLAVHVDGEEEGDGPHAFEPRDAAEAKRDGLNPSGCDYCGRLAAAPIHATR